MLKDAGPPRVTAPPVGRLLGGFVLREILVQFESPGRAHVDRASAVMLAETRRRHQPQDVIEAAPGGELPPNERRLPRHAAEVCILLAS